MWVVRTPADVRDVVARMAAAGMEGIKVVIESELLGPAPNAETPQMPLELVQAAVEEARKHGLPVFAHATDPDELKVAVQAGVRAAVHLVHCCPPNGKAGPLYGPDPDLLAAMRQQEIYYVSTLSTMIWADMWGDPSKYLTDPFLSGIEKRLIDTLLTSPPPPPADVDWAYRRSVLRTLKAAHDAGIKLVGGSDAAVAFVFHGYSMHHEPELMVEAGLTPMEALVAATRRAAEMIGATHEFGTIEPGNRADLLILGANPLETIRNTRRSRSL